jgi:hypothetical protein
MNFCTLDLFFTDDILKKICDEINLYADQVHEVRRLLKKLLEWAVVDLQK